MRAAAVTPLRWPRARFDAAIVDLDGTLVDTQDDFVAALNATLDELALPPIDAAFVVATVGRGSEHLLRSVLAHVGAAADRYDAAWVAYQRHYRHINGRHARVYPGAAAALAQWRAAGVRLACLTNKPTAFAHELLERCALRPAFERVFGGDAFARKKPDPLPVLETCAALGVAPQRTVMVGDSSNDAQAAQAAGVAVVLVRTGYNHGQPVELARPDGVLDRLDALHFD